MVRKSGSVRENCKSQKSKQINFEYKMSSLNTEGFGEPIAIIQDINASKKKRNSKKKIMNTPNEYQFCYKKTTASNKARHLQTCPVKKAGGSHSNKVISQ